MLSFPDTHTHEFDTSCGPEAGALLLSEEAIWPRSISQQPLIADRKLLLPPPSPLSSPPPPSLRAYNTSKASITHTNASAVLLLNQSEGAVSENPHASSNHRQRVSGPLGTKYFHEWGGGGWHLTEGVSFSSDRSLSPCSKNSLVTNSAT